MAASWLRFRSAAIVAKPQPTRQGMQMSKNSSRPVGRHFLHIPGPTPLPDRILRAMDTPIIDHRGPEFARLGNTLSPGDRVLMVETGQFALQWKNMAARLGVVPEFIKTDWRIGADPKVIEARLREDK